MKTATEALPPVELRSTLCPNCGYALEGLTCHNNCPECGRENDPHEIVFNACFPGTLAAHEQSPSEINWKPIVSLSVLLVWFFFFFSISKVFYLASLITLSTHVVRQYDRRHPGVLQVRIYPTGLVQFYHSGGAAFVHKVGAGFSWIVPTLFMFAGAFWLQQSPALWKLVFLVPLLGVSLIFLVAWMIRARRFFRVNRTLFPNSLVDGNLVFNPLLPWIDVGEYWINPGRNGWYYLRVNKTFRRDSVIGAKELVHAQIKLTPAGADWLHEYMREKILAARAEHGFQVDTYLGVVHKTSVSASGH